MHSSHDRSLVGEGLEPTFDPDRWVPPSDRLPNYRVVRFMDAAGIGSFDELVSRAAQDPAWFYPQALDFLGLRWMRPWDELFDESDGVPFTRWFVGGETNISWLVAEAGAGEDEVLVWEGDDGETVSLTRTELLVAVRSAAAGLRSMGIERGSVVVIHLPMITEAVIALLAVAHIGAIAAPAFSGYGVEPLAERIELSDARLVITADGMKRRGKALPMAQTAIEAIRQVSGNPGLVVVSRLGADPRTFEGAIPWSTLVSQPSSLPPLAVPAEHPWLLTFTSGSTGRPKGVVHTHGGMPYGGGIELAFSLDVGAGDRLSWPSDMGWIVGPLLTVVPLLLGATAVIYEGVPDYPEPDRLWELVDRHRLTHLGMSPTSMRMLVQSGSDWVDRHPLHSLRILGSTGEPATVPAFKWLHLHAGRGRVPIINWAGGTEIGGGILMGSPAVPTVLGRFSGPSVGMDVDVVDEQGASVTEQVGELILRRTWPSMTRGFWNDNDRYLETYWSKLPGAWVHGDRAIRHADGSWELPGRSDDLMKISGKRVGPAEIEAAACDVDGVMLAGAVGIPDPIKGEVAVVAVVAPGHDGDEALEARIAERIITAMGPTMRPRAVVVVDELPLTRSAKVHRRVLKAWLTGTDPGDVSSLQNPEAKAAIELASRRLVP